MELGSSEAALLIKDLLLPSLQKKFFLIFFLSFFSFLRFKIAGGSLRREYIHLLQRQGEVKAPSHIPIHPASPLRADSERTFPKGGKCRPEQRVFSDDLFATSALDKPLGLLCIHLSLSSFPCSWRTARLL